MPQPPFEVSVRKASFEKLFNISYWLWRFNPSAAVPAMLSGAVDVVKQSAVLVVFMVTISLLASGGILRQLAEALTGNDPFAILGAFSSPQLISSLLWAIAASVALYYGVSILGGGFINSAEYGSYIQLLRTGKLSISDVVEKAGRRWIDMAITVMVTEAVKYGPLVATLMWILSLGATKFLSEGYFGLLPHILFSLSVLAIAAIYTALMLILTIYTYPAAANGANWHAALRQSLRACRASPSGTLLYVLVRVLSSAAILGLSYVSGLLSVQVSSLLTALASLALTPILHTMKTALFLRAETEHVIIPLLPGPPFVGDAPRYVWGMCTEKIMIGMRELSKFLLSVENMPFHAISVLTFTVGVMAGGQVSSSGLSQLLFALGYKSGEVNPSFTGFALPFLAVDISFHNWQVSLATALSGLALMAPTLVTMSFNGFILGVVGSLVPNMKMFLAAILPHGIVELPSFILSGSVGSSLAYKFMKALMRGESSTDAEVHRAVRQSIYIILGLTPFFILAGIIEAFITPFIMRLYGWG